ncbi:MAG TPA: ABC transporter permease [Thermomicrobiales bacterium]|nr:ABC transporter permease [Thermomicrobiales bacterium]
MATRIATAAMTAPRISPRPTRLLTLEAAHALGRNRIALIGFGVVVAWLLLGLLAPVLPIADPDAQALSERLKPPGGGHLLGTDDLGRDILSRLIHGARVSVPAGILVILVTGTIGSLLGAAAGYFGGAVDAVVMRVADAVLSFPSIILAMTITAVRGGPGLGNALIAVGFVLWPEYARLMRGQVLAIRSSEFVLAAESVGVSHPRILFRHVLPSADAPLIVKATIDVGAAIVLTAGLSFIGLGAVPPTAEWGAMIKQGADKGLQYWWYALVPGLAIMSVVMGLNFFGDGLRDALDPRRRGR